MAGRSKKKVVTTTYGVAITPRFGNVPTVYCDRITNVVHTNAVDTDSPRWRTQYAIFSGFRNATVFALETGASQIVVFYENRDTIQNEPDFVVELPFSFDNLIREATDREDEKS